MRTNHPLHHVEEVIARIIAGGDSRMPAVNQTLNDSIEERSFLLFKVPGK